MRTFLRVTCAILALAGTPSPGAAQEAAAPAIGPETAASQFEVFLDLSGERSNRLAVILDALRHRHPREVRIVVRQLPPENEVVAELLHRAALAAGRQNRYWEMARLILANQEHASREHLLGMAAQLELDVERFAADLDDAGWVEALQADRERATQREVKTAPTLLHNELAIAGEVTLERLEALVSAAR